MEALRVLTIDQSKLEPFLHSELINSLRTVRDYHRSYYVPHNLSLMVAGKLAKGTDSLLSVLQDKVEPSLIAHGQNAGSRPSGWKRPFLETSSANRRPMTKTVFETVEFPEQDETMGELLITFMGPPRENFLELQVITPLRCHCANLLTCIHDMTGPRCPRNLFNFVGCGTSEQGICGDRVTAMVCHSYCVHLSNSRFI